MMQTPAGPFILGIDLGKTADYTALVLAEPNADPKPIYDLTHIERVPLKTRYSDVAVHVAGMVTGLKETPRTEVTVVLDYTGVGIAVAEMFLPVAARCPLVLVTITGGTKVTRDEMGFHIPKADLVSVVQRTLQEERLRVPEDDPSSDLLLKELADFQAIIRPSGHVSYEAAIDWRSGKHDDLVLAASFALWYGEQARVVAEIW